MQGKLSKNGKKLGRPTKFNKRVAMAILEGLSNGLALKAICAEESMPERWIVYAWLRDDSKVVDIGGVSEKFSHLYNRACEEKADALADELQMLADESDLSKEAILKARLQVDTRKWIASKLKPRKYGDRLDMTSDGEKLDGLVIVRSDTPKS